MIMVPSKAPRHFLTLNDVTRDELNGTRAAQVDPIKATIDWLEQALAGAADEYRRCIAAARCTHDDAYYAKVTNNRRMLM